MAGNEKYYDTAKMRNAANEIRSQVTKYKNAKQTVDTTIKQMQAYWQDSVNQNFVRRYNSSMEPTVEGIRKLMEAYATFLDDSAQQVDKWVAQGNSSIN